MSSLNDDIRRFYRNALRMTAQEHDSRNLLSAIRRDLFLSTHGISPNDPVVKGILVFCSEEKLGTLILNWSPLKRYLKEADAGLADKYLKRIEDIEAKLRVRRYF